MDRAVDTATTKQRLARGVDDGVDLQLRDVGADDFDHARQQVYLMTLSRGRVGVDLPGSGAGGGVSSSLNIMPCPFSRV